MSFCDPRRPAQSVKHELWEDCVHSDAAGLLCVQEQPISLDPVGCQADGITDSHTAVPKQQKNQASKPPTILRPTFLDLISVLVDRCQNANHFLAVEWHCGTKGNFRRFQLTRWIPSYPFSFLCKAEERPKPFELLRTRTLTVFPFGPHEIVDRDERFRQIAKEYAKRPEGTLVVSPDNQSRMEINQIIHKEMQARGQVDRSEEKMKVLVARHEVTGADRQWAEQYHTGDIVRYTKGSKTHGIKAGEFARVERIDAKENLVSVKKQSGREVTYDPRRLQGVTLYRETDRAFSRGGRIQFTAPNREQHIANREFSRFGELGPYSVRTSLPDTAREVFSTRIDDRQSGPCQRISHLLIG